MTAADAPEQKFSLVGSLLDEVYDGSDPPRLWRDVAAEMQEKWGDYPTLSAKLYDREKARESEQRACREAIERAADLTAKLAVAERRLTIECANKESLTWEVEHWHARADRAEAALVAAQEALFDMREGWRYIRDHHGDLYGVGWDRAQERADAALATIAALAQIGESTVSERWRVGRHFPIHIYEGEDIPVATALTVAYAKQIVADHNSAFAFPQPDALKLAEEALDDIARQKMIDEMDDDEIDSADLEGGWDTIILRARESLAAIRATQKEISNLKENENGK